MFWYGHDGGWGWFAMSVSMVLFWAVIIGVGVLLFRALGRTAEHPYTHTPAGPSPEQLLAERFARGEIDEEEYQRRLATLRASPPSTKQG
ncbi:MULTISPECIES: SHOCT domain-containing protein [unclassified Streptomyces]|uniref:SHOCT domain-containing protein n=1 Tax=unclassified Streptomyces TaxID=2593676 RepID=UPI002E8003E1|nr:SHOCT domain-containing protein [Streptomyces sp. NBC_00589]WTI34366.1 SHOCT domain-containing protein [Streptomyces sp. NBC_00775]WUB31962.1 SHOCT domain-containing protein [Streptomyces sp. NBC_00589]